MEDVKEALNKGCGEKRKAPKRDKSERDGGNVSKKPWGTNGPPPPEWIEVQVHDVDSTDL